jgi:8-oxo-dGTP diphosphatase
MDGKLRNMAGVYIFNGDRMLLLYRVGSRVGVPDWRNIGGHFEIDELNDAKAAMLRELNEEIGLKETDLCNIVLKYITLRLTAGEIRLNYYFFADLAEDARTHDTCDEGILEWVKTDEINDRTMPVTAQAVMKHYLDTGKYTSKLYIGVTNESGVQFTVLDET